MVSAVTGTRDGMTKHQAFAVQGLYRQLDLSVMHNGACSGSDRQFFNLLEFFPVVHFWPSNEEQQRWAYKMQRELSRMDIEVHPLHRPLVRDRMMVQRAKEGRGVLIATPRTIGEELRSGTWATIRYARNERIPRYIVRPDGTVEVEE